MMGGEPHLEEFRSLNSVSISQLSPSLNRLDQQYVYATVMLLWPYSSTTKQFSLLLSEPDFRLRGANGQVKVNFRGKAAEAVASAKVGIGDNIYLALDGAELKVRDNGASDTARGIEWDLLFDSRVLLEVISSAYLPFCGITILILYDRCTGNQSYLAVSTSNQHPQEPCKMLKRQFRKLNWQMGFHTWHPR